MTIGLGLSAHAQDPIDLSAVKKIKAEGLNNSKVMDIAYHITDITGPRLSNSPGLKRAQNWIVKYLQQIGLKNVTLEAWGEFGKGWQLDKMYAATILPYYHPIIAYPKAWTPGTKGLIKSTVVLLEADTISDLAKYAGKLKGKIVILEHGSSQSLKNSDVTDFSRYTDENLAKIATPEIINNINEPVNRTMLLGKAQKQGAMMMRSPSVRIKIDSILFAEKIGLKLTLSKGSHGTLFISNGASYKLNAKPVSPELEISGEDYFHILRLLRGGQKVEMEAEIKTSFYGNDPMGYNVIGEIPGTDPILKDEIVMIGAHLDSWHSGTGATDNAAGCSVMIEAIRILKSINFRPKRTIRIALWSAEEQGLLGSNGYVKKHFGNPANMNLKPEHEKLSAYFNLDNGAGIIRGIYSQGNKAAKDIFSDWLLPFADLGAKTTTANSTYGTDHLSFDAVGLPGFQFIQDPLDYYSRTHHSNQDTFDRLLEDDLKKSSTIIASFIYHTSERGDKLPRKKK